MASTVTTDTPPAALQQFLPYLISGASTLFSGISATSHFFWSLTSTVTRSVLVFSPIPALLYLFAPVIVLSELVVDVFVRFPYHAILVLLDAFYPIYVFFGVACIIGGLIGLLGRLASKVAVDIAVNRYQVKHEWPETIPIKRERRTKVKVET